MKVKHEGLLSNFDFNGFNMRPYTKAREERARLLAKADEARENDLAMAAQAKLDSGEIQSVEEDDGLAAFHSQMGPTELDFDTPCGSEVCSTCAREVEIDTVMRISCVSGIGDANSAADYVISGVTAGRNTLTLLHF